MKKATINIGRRIGTLNFVIAKYLSANSTNPGSKIKKNFQISVSIETSMVYHSSLVGSGCGSVGRVVASITRGPLFKSSHWQNLYRTLFSVKCIEKDKNKEKRPGMAHFSRFFRILQPLCYEIMHSYWLTRVT